MLSCSVVLRKPGRRGVLEDTAKTLWTGSDDVEGQVVRARARARAPLDLRHFSGIVRQTRRVIRIHSIGVARTAVVTAMFSTRLQSSSAALEQGGADLTLLSQSLAKSKRVTGQMTSRLSDFDDRLARLEKVSPEERAQPSEPAAATSGPH